MNVSATNSLTLRLFYTGNKSLVGASARKEETKGKLSMADATALRAGIRRLQDFDFEDAKEEVVQEKLQAFVDTYNYTLESGGKYAPTDTAVKNAVSNMKNLSKEHTDELAKLGITVDKKTGQMTLSDSAAKNIHRERFTKFFVKDNEYLEDLYKSAKHITRKVDIYL